jgi:hypothetical protein
MEEKPSQLPPEVKNALLKLIPILYGIHMRLAREKREKESRDTSGPVDIKTAWRRTTRRTKKSL